MQNVRLMILVMLLGGCSNEGINGLAPRIHGDERSVSERYQRCISGNKRQESRSERVRCAEESRHPDPDYIGVSFPVIF